MERRQFIGSLSGPVVAACAVCLGACSKSSSTTNGTSSGSNVPTPANVNFTVDLGSSLTTIGSSLVQSGVIVVRIAGGNAAASFTAVQAACTHEGTTINFSASGNQFVCPNHGSTFSTSGKVTLGPASTALKQFTVVVNGSIMTVTG